MIVPERKAFMIKFIGEYTAKVDALKRNARRRLRTDFLFHSIIGAASIESVYKEESLDIFK